MREWYAVVFLPDASLHDMPIASYNRALYLAQWGEYMRAKEVLESVLPELSDYTTQSYELYGDILWHIHAETGAIRDAYQQALEQENIPRIAYKIGILDAKYTSETDTLGTGWSLPESSEIEKTIQNIQKEQSERKDAMNPLPTDAATQRAEYERLRYLIESDVYTQDKDW